MSELFKVPILRSNDNYQLTHEMLKKVVLAAFPGAKLDTEAYRPVVDGVEFDAMGGGGWHPAFEGIQLKVNQWRFAGRVSRHSRSPFKRVMVKDGLIDLEAIRSKHAELVVIAKQMQEHSDTIRTAESRRLEKVRALEQELKLGSYVLASGAEDQYHIEFRGLSADDVRAVVLLLRSRNALKEDGVN